MAGDEKKAAQGMRNGQAEEQAKIADMAGDLAEYLPPVALQIQDVARILALEQPYMALAWQHVEQVLLEQLIMQAGEYGIGRWEKLLQLCGRESLQLEERRRAVLLRLNEQLPFTMARLRELLAVSLPEGEYLLTLDPAAYTLHVFLELSAKNCAPALRELLQRVVPANLRLDLQLLYNTYGRIKGYTHRQLAALRHWEIREEVLN